MPLRDDEPEVEMHGPKGRKPFKDPDSDEADTKKAARVAKEEGVEVHLHKHRDHADEGDKTTGMKGWANVVQQLGLAGFIAVLLAMVLSAGGYFIRDQIDADRADRKSEREAFKHTMIDLTSRLGTAVDKQAQAVTDHSSQQARFLEEARKYHEAAVMYQHKHLEILQKIAATRNPMNPNP